MLSKNDTECVHQLHYFMVLIENGLIVKCKAAFIMYDLVGGGRFFLGGGSKFSGKI